MVYCFDRIQVNNSLVHLDSSVLSLITKDIIVGIRDTAAGKWVKFACKRLRNVLLLTKRDIRYVCVFTESLVTLKQKLHFSKHTRAVSPGVYKIDNQVFLYPQLNVGHVNLSQADVTAIKTGMITDRIVDLTWSLISPDCNDKSLAYLNPILITFVIHGSNDVVKSCIEDAVNIHTELVYFPLVYKTHWYFIVFELQSNVVTCADSLGKELPLPLKTHVLQVASMINGSAQWTVRSLVTKKVQTDSISCGVFVICWMIHHMLYRQFSVKCDNVSNFRLWLDLLIRLQVK